MDEKTITRFWKKVDRDGPTPPHMPHLGPCWVWTANRSSGYGYMSVGGRAGAPMQAHRISWMVHFPTTNAAGWCVCHACDNRACVNPHHLFLGTKADNSLDMRSKGRGKLPPPPGPGEANRNAKLREEDVRAIRERRASGEPLKKIASDFGIDWSTVSDVARRKAWRHIA